MIAAARIDGTVSEPKSNPSLVTVKVYTRHTRSCPKRDRPDWARCNCVKWLYIYRDGKDKLISAKTRSWERAEQKARELRDFFDPIKQLQSRLEAKAQADNSQIEVAVVGHPSDVAAVPLVVCPPRE